MSDLQKIESTLALTARRKRLENALRRLSQGLLWGAAAWVLLLAIYKLAPIPARIAREAWIVLPIAALAGFLFGWTRKVTLAETARFIDSRKMLQERLSTALEVSAGNQSEEWKNLVVTDAAKALSKVNPKELLPFRFPRTSRWAIFLLITGIILGFVPEYRTKAYAEKKKDEKIIKEVAKELAQLTKHNLESRPPAMERTKKSIEEVRDLADFMGKAQLTRSEALKNLANTTEKLKNEMREVTKNPAIRNLERAARESSKGGSTSADLQQKIDSLAKQLGTKAANSDALDKMKKDLAKAREMAANLPKGDSPEAKEAREKMNATLSDLAKQAKEMGLDLPSLSEAIASLQNAQPDQVLTDLKMAEVDLEKVQAMAKALEKMQLDAQKLGKDLAEQLKNGQAEAAQSTLQKMINQLQSGKTSPEQMQKIMSEVSKALEPAKQYGEVSDELKKAMAQMKNGDKDNGAKSLAKASEALGKMMQDLGDAQSLLATLESLQQAQMSIANGQGWGEGSMASKSSRRGKGKGTSRSGVGTWTDEDSWVYPEYSDKWDNTGVTRDDMDGKGITDRGDGNLADNLAPTKIKGQITPGGPMPSITMKGVSIKGTSKVQYQEMAASAQSEAQSALNQDQVPRAYQNSVRNYFDDLKQ
jgi:hypothetical protein